MDVKTDTLFRTVFRESRRVYQQTGGYPMVGVVSRLDLFKVVQAFPGTPIRFALADPIRLRSELMRFYNFWGLS